MVRRPNDSRDEWFWGEMTQEEARHGEAECKRPPIAWSSPDTLRLDDCRPPSHLDTTSSNSAIPGWKLQLTEAVRTAR
jgi:hypothetical protein